MNPDIIMMSFTHHLRPFMECTVAESGYLLKSLNRFKWANKCSDLELLQNSPILHFLWSFALWSLCIGYDETRFAVILPELAQSEQEVKPYTRYKFFSLFRLASYPDKY